MSILPNDAPEFGAADSKKAPTPRRRHSLVDYLWLLALLVVLIAILLPSLRLGSPTMVRRSQCMGNLREIARALNAYVMEHGALPPAYTVDADGRPLHSWRTLILPYLGQGSLYESIDLAKPWNDPANARAFETPLQVYQCPNLAGWLSNKTIYRASVGPHAFLRPAEPRPLATITDDKATTLAVIEVDHESAVPWMSPEDADEAIIEGLGADSKLVHPGGLHLTTADRSVIFASPELRPDLRRALITVDGGEAVSRDLLIR
ncbi:DUF1559 family PulG-like putative transporter [Paludisphaera rhizosphaerae]|uniref:DUF1559 family PulG-like putative transporter n=1 Tax=Paludisphaera rhizosphaerae TaxID=2711216 RepID=UPI0013EADE7D|nr:DUF1559 domain-containing protein [Paludisphaera rhizosphaerae]